jgi:glycosyltransferase involved in cell wall biosynthesis
VTDLISVIVTTYEREDALNAVLRSLAGQTDHRFEVVVADDGSGPRTAAVIEHWKVRLGVPLAHVWQEHRGFRPAEMRNRAILATQGAYCVFLDGDCLARPDFIATHRRLAEPGWFVTGNRALMSADLSAAVLRDHLEPERWGLRDWIAQRSSSGLNRLSPVLRLRLGPLRKLRSTAWRGARSCNLAVWRADLDRVDGFDAAFIGWGREDSDFLVRLLRTGVRRKDGTFAAGVLHLWHPEADRSGLAANESRLDSVLRGDRVRAERGMSRLASPANSAAPHAAAMTEG